MNVNDLREGQSAVLVPGITADDYRIVSPLSCIVDSLMETRKMSSLTGYQATVKFIDEVPPGSLLRPSGDSAFYCRASDLELEWEWDC